MERLEGKHVVAAVTTFVGIVYLVCVALIALVPTASLNVANLWVHGLDLTAIAKTPTWSETLLGFITIIIATVLASALFVKVWNLFTRREST